MGIIGQMSLFSCSDSEGITTGTGIERKDIELTRVQSELAHKQYDFPVKLLESAYMVNEGKNVTVSPLSASMVLGMITNALDESDRDEILKTLNLTADELDDYNEYNRYVSEMLPGLDPKAEFTSSNAFWLRNDGTMSAGYEDLLKNRYRAETGRFNSFDLETVSKINSWISGKTSGAIPSLLEPADANPDVNSVWANALYFKGIWTQRFNKELTIKDSFYPSYPAKGDGIDVDMMYGGRFRYLHFKFMDNGEEMDYWQRVLNSIATVMLPYGNESFIFMAVLPPDNHPDIAFTLKELDAEYWQEVDRLCSYKSDPGDIYVKIPKINTEKRTDLIPVLSNMGLNDIFIEVSMEEALGYGNQRVGLFRQSTVFEMDEEGSTIKSASVATGGSTSAAPEGVVFDRPFIYFVRERSTGAVLLAGVYTCPE